MYEFMIDVQKKLKTMWEYKHNLDNFNLDPGSVPDGEALDYYFFDEAMYIGRIQINLNNGKKRKFLYFQADYKIRK